MFFTIQVYWLFNTAEYLKVVVIRNVMPYTVVCSIPEGSCQWGCGGLQIGVQHARRLLWSLGMWCHIFWYAPSQKALLVTGGVVANILVHSIPEGSCGHLGCCAIHFGVHIPRRFLWSLGMLPYSLFASSQKVLVVTGDVFSYSFVHSVRDPSINVEGYDKFSSL